MPILNLNCTVWLMVQVNQTIENNLVAEKILVLYFWPSDDILREFLSHIKVNTFIFCLGFNYIPKKHEFQWIKIKIESDLKTSVLKLTADCLPKFATGLNVHFRTISSHFFANYMNIFHKTEVQSVILRCWTGLKLNWFKSYDTNANKRKKCIKQKKHYTNNNFFTKLKKKNEMGNICVLCHNF